MARKAVKKAKKAPYKRRAAQPKATTAPRKSRFTNLPKFGAFLKTNGSHYTVVFTTRRPPPSGFSLTAFVRKSVRAIATGPFELMTEITSTKMAFVTVAFVLKSDFDAVCKKFKATPAALRPFKTTVASAGVII